MPMDFVIGKLNGFHGTFVNNKSIKYYFILDGKAKVTIDGEITEVEKGDFVVIPVNAKHSIDGVAEFAIACTPSFDPKDEKII
jgi:mannose-6-phosphate isomerase-like protein (cupin superfamily)